LKEFKFNRNFKFESNNSELVKEVCAFLGASAMLYDEKYYHYKCDQDRLTYTTENNNDWYSNTPEPELNLKTGEVIPVEVEPKKHIDNCCHCYGMSQELTQEQMNNDKLNYLLKEKDRVLENMNTLLKAHVKELKEKEALIQKVDTSYSNLEAKLKEKDAEIERLRDNFTKMSKAHDFTLDIVIQSAQKASAYQNSVAFREIENINL